jgi:hypothetical protein
MREAVSMKETVDLYSVLKVLHSSAKSVVVTEHSSNVAVRVLFLRAMHLIKK